TERCEYVRCPRPERDNGLIGFERALVGLNLPKAARLGQRARVAGDEEASERDESRRKGPRYCQRIGDAGGARPKHRVLEYGCKRRLEVAHCGGVEDLVRNVELDGEFEFGADVDKGPMRAINF